LYIFYFTLISFDGLADGAVLRDTTVGTSEVRLFKFPAVSYGMNCHLIYFIAVGL